MIEPSKNPERDIEASEKESEWYMPRKENYPCCKLPFQLGSKTVEYGADGVIIL